MYMLPRRYYLSAFSLVVLLGACSWLLITRWPRSINSHRDQVEAALREKALSAQQISFGERWPDNINFQYGENVFPYGYPVQIILSDGRVVRGAIQCAKFERNCLMRAEELGIYDVRLPDFTKERPLPLPGWAERPVRQALRVLGFE